MHYKKLDSALWWLSQGAHLIPKQPGTKENVRGFGAHQRTIFTGLDAQEWFLGRRCNLAVVVPPGRVCVDFDNPDVYGPWRSGPGAAVQTVMEKSRRGWHVWGLDDLPEGAAAVAGVEFKRAGSVVTVAPSEVGGFRYQLLTDWPMCRLPLSALLCPPPTKQGVEPKLPSPGAASGAGLIAKIKNEFDILSVAGEITTLSQTGSGRYWVGKCPFHPDSGRHFWADSDRGLCGCHFAGCRFAGRGQDVVSLMAARDGVTIREVVKRLAAEVGK